MTELFAPAKSKKISVDIFGVTILCLTSIKQMREFEKHNREIIDAPNACTLQMDEMLGVWDRSRGASIRMNVDDETFYIMMLKDKNHVTAAHEAVHMSGQILDVKGVPISMDNDEVRAYLTGYIFESLCDVAGLTIKR